MFFISQGKSVLIWGWERVNFLCIRVLAWYKPNVSTHHWCYGTYLFFLIEANIIPYPQQILIVTIIELLYTDAMPSTCMWVYLALIPAQYEMRRSMLRYIYIRQLIGIPGWYFNLVDWDLFDIPPDLFSVVILTHRTGFHINSALDATVKRKAILVTGLEGL
jgi:hypothetical protein